MITHEFSDDIPSADVVFATGARVAIPLDELLSHRWLRLRRYLETFEAQVRQDGTGEPGDYVVIVTLEHK